MKLIIDIPERLWTKQLTADDYIEIVNAVANGTPLEAQPAEECGMTNEEAIDKLKMWYSMMNSVENPDSIHLDNMAVILTAIKALEQQPCEDCISRAEVQNLIATWLSDYLSDETREALETIDGKVGDMPSVQPRTNLAETSQDCISRQAVLDELDKYIDKAQSTGTRDDFISFQELVVKQLPSVTPQRPKGKWLEVEVHNCHATLKCSVCNRVIEPCFNFGEYSYEDIKTFYPYCHCGAEMSGGGEDEE